MNQSESTDSNSPEEKKTCIGCGRPLLKRGATWLCIECNRDQFDVADLFDDQPEDDGYILIECPGASLYKPGTNEVVEGVRFVDEDDPSKGHEIVGSPVYPPNHRNRRRIKQQAYGKIRRCQACQDYTIRMRRKEGADFFIPSPKYPGRKKLKSVTHSTYRG